MCVACCCRGSGACDAGGSADTSGTRGRAEPLLNPRQQAEQQINAARRQFEAAVEEANRSGASIPITLTRQQMEDLLRDPQDLLRQEDRRRVREALEEEARSEQARRAREALEEEARSEQARRAREALEEEAHRRAEEEAKAATPWGAAIKRAAEAERAAIAARDYQNAGAAAEAQQSLQVLASRGDAALRDERQAAAARDWAAAAEAKKAYDLITSEVEEVVARLKADGARRVAHPGASAQVAVPVGLPVAQPAQGCSPNPA